MRTLQKFCIAAGSPFMATWPHSAPFDDAIHTTRLLIHLALIIRLVQHGISHRAEQRVEALHISQQP